MKLLKDDLEIRKYYKFGLENHHLTRIFQGNAIV